MNTILVVDDFVPVLKFLRETLEGEGYNTIGATNARQAFDILLNQFQRISMIILDYHMPDSNGYDLQQRIKATPELSHLPIVFLTAESNPEIKKAVTELGCSAWINKPYRSGVLLSEVKKVLSFCSLASNRSVNYSLF